MSPTTPRKSPPARSGPVLTTSPARGARTTRSATLLLLVGADVIVAAMMVGEALRFVISPDPDVKAGPMLVTLALTTGASLLMVLLALNYTFLPLFSRRRTNDLSLIMYGMGATGVVTGMLTVGAAAGPLIARLFVGALAYVFIWMQARRIERARAQGVVAGPAARTAAPRRTAPPARSRQRRGGRKR
jgi:hypothetical protein